jgi:hypothetical protein
MVNFRPASLTRSVDSQMHPGRILGAAFAENQ